MINQLLNSINPSPKVGGLEISEADIKYAAIHGKRVFTVLERLPLGVIEGGVVKDAGQLKKILQGLHNKVVGRRNKKTAIILNIPDVNVYTQVFGLPFVASANLEEAVRLNLQMISPIAFENAYSGWQQVGETEAEGGQFEILGAFASRTIVDEYTNILEDANFSFVAVEFPSLALTRFLGSDGKMGGFDSLILIRLSSSGLSFSIIKKRNLYFNHSIAWQATTIPLKEFEDAVIKETQKVLNFYASHWQPAVNDLFLILPTSALEETASAAIKSNFSIQIHPFKTLLSADASKINLSNLNPAWYAVLGSALRALVPRSDDDSISLSGVGTIERFRQGQILNFVRFWRNMAFTAVGAVLIFSIGAELFLINTAKSLESRLSQTKSNAPPGQQLNALVDEARKFNAQVDLALQARRQVADWTPYLERIRDLAGQNVTVQRVLIQSLDTPVIFSGQAINEDAILKFKDAVSQDLLFSDVNLPLSSVTQAAGGLVNFSMSFRIKPLK